MTESAASRFPAYQHVRIGEARPQVVTVELDRPPVNALDRTLRGELLDAFDRIRDARLDDSARVVVLASSGRHFCAGADLDEKASLGGHGERAAADRLVRDLFFAVLDCPLPVVAAVHGAAVGAGWVLAGCADIVLASDDALFALPEIDVGQGGGTSILQRIVPSQALHRLALTAERIDATEAHRLGAVSAVHPAEQLRAAALDLAATIAAKSPTAAQAVKRSFAAVVELSVREGFELEQRYTDELSRSPEAARARQRFLHKTD